MFEILHNDNLKIIKKDGQQSTMIKALVDKNTQTIHILRKFLPQTFDIEEGDQIERLLPNNKTEKYLVVDPGYKPAFMTIPETYECKVQKENGSVAETGQTVYNIHGHNARVYSHSQDYSANTLHFNDDNVFSELASAIRCTIPDSAELITLIKDMQENKGKSTFLTTYQNFVAAAANHMTIISPFIPQLTQMLT